jgi:CheY-like chemotaxis protein
LLQEDRSGNLNDRQLTADNGFVALEKIATEPPDLILLDIMMPGMTGYDVTRCIRQNQQFCSIPILLITAYDRASADEGFQVGANGFIRKPINLDELLSTVKGLCRPQ